MMICTLQYSRVQVYKTSTFDNRENNIEKMKHCTPKTVQMYKTRLFRLYIIYSTYTANDSRYGFYSKGFSVCPFKNI